MEPPQQVMGSFLPVAFFPRCLLICGSWTLPKMMVVCELISKLFIRCGKIGGKVTKLLNNNTNRMNKYSIKDG